MRTKEELLEALKTAKNKKKARVQEMTEMLKAMYKEDTGLEANYISVI